MENYIVINGKKAELTEEQLEKLGIKPKKDNMGELFGRKNEQYYYYIDSEGCAIIDNDEYWPTDDDRFNTGNYCTDEKIMKQRALHETLNRLLWRASVIAGEMNNPWDGVNDHWSICCCKDNGDIKLVRNVLEHCGQIYFPTRETAQAAIADIVNPFMKEHPDFVW